MNETRRGERRRPSAMIPRLPDDTNRVMPGGPRWTGAELEQRSDVASCAVPYAPSAHRRAALSQSQRHHGRAFRGRRGTALSHSRSMLEGSAAASSTRNSALGHASGASLQRLVSSFPGRYLSSAGDISMISAQEALDRSRGVSNASSRSVPHAEASLMRRVEVVNERHACATCPTVPKRGL